MIETIWSRWDTNIQRTIYYVRIDGQWICMGTLL